VTGLTTTRMSDAAVPDDADTSTRGHVDLVRSLERAIAVAKRRRRYRLGLALIALAALTTLVALAVILLVNA
jgi:hypothetical protein